MIAGVLAMVLGLFSAWAAQEFYVQRIQRDQCYAYAHLKQIPEINSLEFSQVVIATNQFRGHTCVFSDKRTNTPIVLEFDDTDIPWFTDTFQVLCMIGAFLCIGASGWGAGMLLLMRVSGQGNQ